MINVLMISNNLDTNGMTSVILNYALNLDNSGLNISIATGSPQKESYVKQLNEKNIKVYLLPKRKKRPVKYRNQLKKLIKENDFDIVHVHGNSSTMVLELSAAKKYGVKGRIAHCHNSTCGSMLRHKLLLPFFKKSYTHAFACSKLAGDWIFGENNFTVINNCFNTQRFKFNEEARNSVRAEFGFKDKFVMGHIGRFNDQKNHPYLLKVFEKTAEQLNSAHLLLVGNGPDFDAVKALIDNHPYKERITVLGETDAPEDLYSAMDAFLLPSKHEGLGIVLLEAQISGLPCLASVAVPEDVVLGDDIKFLPIDEESIPLWAENLSDCCKNAKKRLEFFDLNKEKIGNFDIEKSAAKLQNIYCEMCTNED